VRETLFNWLGQDLTGLSCLDLFAGSGILGFEAASRGAARHAGRARCAHLRRAEENAQAFGDPTGTDPLRCAKIRPRRRRFDVLFLDPPYGQGWIERIEPRLGELAPRRACMPRRSSLERIGFLVGGRSRVGPGRFITICWSRHEAFDRCVYPGTFDPLTRGHEDLVRRASRLFGEGGGRGCRQPQEAAASSRWMSASTWRADTFRLSERRSPRFRRPADGFPAQAGRRIILRGLRAVSDFEYEFQMAGMNRSLNPDVETVFLTPAEKYQFISATTMVRRKFAVLGGDVRTANGFDVQPKVHFERLNRSSAEFRSSASSEESKMAEVPDDSPMSASMHLRQFAACDVCEPS
jgi:pantetheine-phosphate adenylyltransferase